MGGVTREGQGYPCYQHDIMMMMMIYSRLLLFMRLEKQIIKLTDIGYIYMVMLRYGRSLWGKIRKCWFLLSFVDLWYKALGMGHLVRLKFFNNGLLV